ncbi:hypothetical protein [Companilactobacillus hulinensis]|uniref:hypothetical protein n=1 Tax=Companilactobacillus hulinensis TaxID=2486007 RepID=UPI000F78953E|nr:hypothetical protein [Companilactobacillus hulinensis]
MGKFIHALIDWTSTFGLIILILIGIVAAFLGIFIIIAGLISIPFGGDYLAGLAGAFLLLIITPVGWFILWLFFMIFLNIFK